MSKSLPNVEEALHSQESTVVDDESKLPIKESWSTKIKNGVISYFSKFKGVDGKESLKGTIIMEDIFVSVIISFIGIMLISVTSYVYLQNIFTTGAGSPVVMLVGSFGATAVLVFDVYSSPLSQPRNLMGSYFVSSLIGVLVRLFGDYTSMPDWTVAPLAVSLTIGAMRLTKCVHPPAGACALIAVTGGDVITNMGFAYVLTCLGGAFICLCTALIFNNLVPWRQYPQYWI